MAKLFETTNINSMTLVNRFVRSATWSGVATEDGFVTPKLIDLIVKLARGGVGLIVSGYAYVMKNGQAAPRQLGIYSDDLISGLSGMVEAVHQEGGKIVAQIVHCGAFSNSQFTGVTPMGPSVIETAEGPICRAMTLADITRVGKTFQEAAIRAKRAGFDGVQLHGAHAYLLSQFLSPFFNKRTDGYGGNIVNRARIVLDVYQVVRKAVGGQFPVMIKMNATDFLEEDISSSDVIEAAVMLEKAGIDAIELSGGTGWGLSVLGDINKTALRTVKEEAYYRDIAQRCKEKIRVPLILTGGIRSYEVAQQLVEDEVTDYIGLCRPLIREPDLIKRWKTGDIHRSECVSDTACFFAAVKGKDLHCVHLKAK